MLWILQFIIALGFVSKTLAGEIDCIFICVFYSSLRVPAHAEPEFEKLLVSLATCKTAFRT